MRHSSEDKCRLNNEERGENGEMLMKGKTKGSTNTVHLNYVYIRLAELCHFCLNN